MSIVLIYIINIAPLLAASYWLSPRYDKEINFHFWWALFFKVACGLLLGLLFYQHYGTGDTIRFYDEARALASLDLADFCNAVTGHLEPTQQVRAIYFVRLVAMIKYLTHADYWLLSIYFSWFSFLGSFYLVSKLIEWKQDLKFPTLLAFFYFPSTVFWSSGLLKESLVFGAITFLIGIYLSWCSKKQVHKGHVVLAVLSLGTIVLFKYYIAAVLIPVLVYLVIYHLPIWKGMFQGIWVKTFCMAAILIVPVIMFFSWLSPNLNYDRIWQVMQENHDVYIQLTPNRVIETISWFESSWDIIVNIPYLWFSGIFRPIVGENFSILVLFSSLENMVLLLAAVLALYESIKYGTKWTPELIAILLYVSALSIFLSYSTPNFGTLARFKVYYQPFLVLLVAYQLQSLQFFRKN